ncbi:MAG: hypothetical protein JZD40_00115 [Sulfolobus sp.]|nr:hypothetical protein [Sulfolobus sp.]
MENVIILNNTTKWKIRGIGFASFFRLLMILGKYYNITLKGANGTLHIKTEGLKEVEVSVSQQ